MLLLIHCFRHWPTVHGIPQWLLTKIKIFAKPTALSHEGALAPAVMLRHSCVCRSQLQGAVWPAQKLVGCAQQDAAEAAGAGWHL